MNIIASLVPAFLVVQLATGSLSIANPLEQSPEFIKNDIQKESVVEGMDANDLVVIQRSSPKPTHIKTIKVMVSAFSSTIEETDSTPFVTASGTHVRDGVAAANFLRFGTKIRLPGMYGDKKFVVEDRMAPRFSNRIDIWFPTKEQARNFGLRYLEVEIES
jgi:3D (Asp-Asp-Asp) domain-containing protein